MPPKRKAESEFQTPQRKVKRSTNPHPREGIVRLGPDFTELNPLPGASSSRNPADVPKKDIMDMLVTSNSNIDEATIKSVMKDENETGRLSESLQPSGTPQNYNIAPFTSPTDVSQVPNN